MKKILRGFIKFLCRSLVGFFSQAFLAFLMKESKKRRRKQPGKLMAKFRSQPVNLPGAQPLMNPLSIVLFHLCIRSVVSLYTVNGTIKSCAELKYLFCIPDQSEFISLQISCMSSVQVNQSI